MSQIYPKRHPHLTWLTCPQDVTQRWVMPGIAAVKSGQIELGTQLLSLAAQHLIDQGCTALILGCTEIPVALQGVDFSVPVIDATQALAQTCVHWALHRQYDKA
jgi:aspartate racemase